MASNFLGNTQKCTGKGALVGVGIALVIAVLLCVGSSIACLVITFVKLKQCNKRTNEPNGGDTMKMSDCKDELSAIMEEVNHRQEAENTRREQVNDEREAENMRREQVNERQEAENTKRKQVNDRREAENTKREQVNDRREAENTRREQVNDEREAENTRREEVNNRQNATQKESNGQESENELQGKKSTPKQVQENTGEKILSFQRSNAANDQE